MILFTTVLDYSVGMALNFQETLSKRKLLLILSLFGNLSVLGFFKYFHFFTVFVFDFISFFRLGVFCTEFEGDFAGWDFILYVSIVELFYRRL
ncbi:hypothetical protein LEP1GSC150_1013 [Leptospira interrogans serovar Copenhageni str. LT2050]|uniref:Uncharacterized protein n=1 Tax=Leptospira interrogans serovar Copenhageni str. LT2050 TaxID=1001598 RepID=M3H5P3_LEPIT|nr:hypothetical protein LEP1GSC150_1013 [Leptospira interrogans serovar Copenhageni str. LT2050]